MCAIGRQCVRHTTNGVSHRRRWGLYPPGVQPSRSCESQSSPMRDTICCLPHARAANRAHLLCSRCWPRCKTCWELCWSQFWGVGSWEDQEKRDQQKTQSITPIHPHKADSGASRLGMQSISPCMVGPYQWSCGGVPLQWVAQYKYLGIIFDAVQGMGLTFDRLRSRMMGSWAQLRRQCGNLQCVRSVGLLLQLYEACVPPAGSYGCEVWGLRDLPASSRKGRDALGSSHLQFLRALATVPTSVGIVVLLQELGQRPLSHLWWQRVVCFWNSLCSLPDDNLYRQVALDDVSDANTRHVKNWAWSFRRSLRAVGYEFAFTTLLPICLGTVLQLLDAPTAQLLGTLDICPRTCPSQNATLCTYLRWFAKPSGVRRPKSLLQLPISSRCMSVFLRFRMGCHSLPVVRGRRSGVPRRLRLCSYCASHSVGDERHFVFDCIALTPIRVKYLDLFGPTIVTMQQFMWQDNLVGVEHFVFDCFASLQTLGGGQ